MPKSEGSMDAEIVLRDMGEGRPHRYATHQHNIAEGDHNGFYWGHYHSELAGAYNDFMIRVKECIVDKLLSEFAGTN